MTFLTTIKALFATMTALLAIFAPAKPTLYPLTALVVDFDETQDVVICEDYAGNIWEFYGIEDWQEGDLASFIMNDNGTPTIYDDEIVSVRYSGWIGHYGAD